MDMRDWLADVVTNLFLMTLHSLSRSNTPTKIEVGLGVMKSLQ